MRQAAALAAKNARISAVAARWPASLRWIPSSEEKDEDVPGDDESKATGRRDHSLAGAGEGLFQRETGLEAGRFEKPLPGHGAGILDVVDRRGRSVKEPELEELFFTYYAHAREA